MGMDFLYLLNMSCNNGVFEVHVSFRVLPWYLPEYFLNLFSRSFLRCCRFYCSLPVTSLIFTVPLCFITSPILSTRSPIKTSFYFPSFLFALLLAVHDKNVHYPSVLRSSEVYILITLYFSFRVSSL